MNKCNSNWLVGLICVLCLLFAAESGMAKNDKIKTKKIDDKSEKAGTYSVPEGGMTIGLLALGLAGCGVALRFSKNRHVNGKS